MNKNTEERIALVTGASAGIGFEVAKEISKLGMHVIAVARTVGGLEELDDEIKKNGGTATLVPLDITDFDGIDRLGQTIHERWGKLDILIANAGMLGSVTPLTMIEPKNFEEVFAVNVTANYRLIRSLDALLRKSNNAIALFITSAAAQKCRPFTASYSSSKAALNAMVKTWAAETENTNIRVNLVNPGTIRTKMRAQYAPGENPEDVTHPSELAKKIAEICKGTKKHGKTYDFPTSVWDVC